MTGPIQRIVAAAVISSILIPGMTASAAVNLRQISDPASASVIRNSESEQTQKREMISFDDAFTDTSSDGYTEETGHAADASMAGMSVMLDQYFAAVDSGTVSVSAEIEVGRIASDEVESRAVVLEQYTNLGIVVVDNYLNVREEPNLEGRIIGKMLNNSACSILEELDGWYRIESGEVSGYISAEYVVRGDEAIVRAMADAKLRASVNTDALNVRSGPSTESDIITQITTNERYEVIEVLDGWVKISLSSDDYAYVAAEYVEVGYSLIEAIEFEPVSAATEFRINVANYALQFLGNPYVWGGTSLTNGADCSGFVKSVLANYGIWLPRVSSQQAGAGVAVTSAELQPGDLVFYGTGGVVNHVAMYIGNGQVVHAISETRGIGITSLWFSTPLAYRNVIGD